MSSDLTNSLRAAISRSGLTHYRIGLDAGVSPTVLDRFVHGKRDIRLTTAAKVCGVLGLELQVAVRRSRVEAANKLAPSERKAATPKGRETKNRSA
jgi:hypothetical protein